MPPLRWCVQSNIGNTHDLHQIQAACTALELQFEPLDYIPFSTIPPQTSTQGETLFYGSPNLIRLVVESGEWRPGAYWSEALFHASCWLKAYRGDLLNESAERTTLGKLAQSERGDDTVCFIRPEGDLKSFSGTQITMKSLRNWVSRLAHDVVPSPKTPILVAPPKTIQREWRLFIVDKEVIASSLYREADELVRREGAPKEVKKFGDLCAQKWAPDRAFVLDVAQVSDDLKVIEVNGLHSSGFYEACVADVLFHVSNIKSHP